LFGQKKSIVVHPNAKFNLDTRHLAEEAAWCMVVLFSLILGIVSRNTGLAITCNREHRSAYLPSDIL
jgi:hypothetical protein